MLANTRLIHRRVNHRMSLLVAATFLPCSLVSDQTLRKEKKDKKKGRNRNREREREKKTEEENRRKKNRSPNR